MPVATFTIGQVLRQVSAEFPDLTASKIRFLEAEGVLVPARSAAGYRQYSAADVERLRFVLTCQRDRFWPLRKIRDALDSLERGVDPETLAPVGEPSTPQLVFHRMPAEGAAKLPRRELAAASGATDELIAALVSFGLLASEDDGLFGEAQVRIARAAAVLDTRGLEPRHLRSLRTSVDRQADLIHQVARRPAEDGELLELAEASLALYAALLESRISGT